VRFRRTLAVAFAAIAATVTVAPAASADGYHSIWNVGSDKCIQPNPFAANPNAPATRVLQRPCDGTDAQKWSPVLLSGDIYKLQHKSSGLCLNVAGGNQDSTPLDLWTCGVPNSNLKWQLPHHPTGSSPIRIISKVSNGSRCMDVRSGSLEDNAQIQIYRCTADNLAQLWHVR
jgi:hypothetical protein